MFLSLVSLFFYINYVTLSSMGYSVKLEHLQLIAHTGVGEFIIQSGVNRDEVIELSLYLLILSIFSFFLISKILNYFKNISINVSMILIVIFILLDNLLSWYKISADTNSVFDDVYSESIIFRPNVSKFFLDKNKSFKLKNKSKLDTSVACKTEKKAPHIVLFMAESLRADMTTKEIMPHLNSLNGTIFKRHYSTSNATFFSLFSVLYGLFPTYYHDTIKKSKPTLLNIATSLNYHKSIYNTLSLNYGGVNHFLNDNYFDKHYEKIGKTRNTLYMQDQEIINVFKNNFNTSQRAELHLILTNSTHHDYYFPKDKGFEKFNPYSKKHISLLKTDGDLYKKLVFNKYKNATYYLDSLVKQTVDAIKEQSQWDNTIFIFFGDHGEEFFEEGHFLHANRLNYYQTSSALFIHKPLDSKNNKILKTTSHMDILPTIIAILKNSGVDISQPYWIKGKNILSSMYTDRAVFSQQISITKSIRVSIANQKEVFIPTKEEKNAQKKILVDKYIDDLIEY